MPLTQVTKDGLLSTAITDKLGYTPQQVLVSGTNIKTIGGNSLLGAGNLDVGATATNDTTTNANTYYPLMANNQTSG